MDSLSSPVVSPARPPPTVWSVGEELQRRKHLAIPHLEVLVGVRYGRHISGGLDAHVMGIRRAVLRKIVEGGQRAIFVRVPFGTSRALLGASPVAIAGRTVALQELWGRRPTQRLLERLAQVGTLEAAGELLRKTIAQRVERDDDDSGQRAMVLAATALLESDPVGLVADRLGASERHFRRVFRETVGVSPKTYGRLRRFRRVVRLAQAMDRPNWAAIAVDAGYYDQAHLISEFRAIGGASPGALLAELRDAGGEPRT